MNSKLIALATLLAATPLAHALDIGLTAEIRLGKVLPPPPPEVIVIDDSAPKGPPPWAPAHGFRRNRDYYYYPDSNVYFSPTDRKWFYLEGANWRVGASLPTTINLNLERTVSLTMETDRPFENHEQVARYYPKDYFTKKVKIKRSKHNESSAHGKPMSHDDGPGESKGKGKGKGRDRSK
jgi:hypothetical protein